MPKLSWQGLDDPEGKKILQALADAEWDFRTVEGLAQSTGLPIAQVQDLLIKYKDYVRRFPLPDSGGHILYTIAEKPESSKETLAKFSSFVTKTTPKRAK